MSKNTPPYPASLAAAALRLGNGRIAGQLAGWLLTAVVLAYATWFFGYATVHQGPLASIPGRIVASERPFDDLPAMLATLGDAPSRLLNRSGIGKPTTWMRADVPKGLPGQARTLHFTEKSIARGDASLVNGKGQVVTKSVFGVALPPTAARRALPGYAIDIPDAWNESDLQLVLRLEPAGVTNSIGVDLWDANRFQDAQFKLQQRKTMLIGALMLLTVYALAAAQAGKAAYLLVFAFWLVARCGFVIASAGFGFFSFGEVAGSSLGLGLRQVVLLSFPCAGALLVWTLTQAELRGTLARSLLQKIVVISCCATLVVGFMPSDVFQVILWLTSGLVMGAIVIVIASGLRLLKDASARWYLGALLVDVAAGINQLLVSLGVASPVPSFDVEQVSLICAMMTGVAVGSTVAKERARRLQAQESAIGALARYEAVYRTVPIGLISFGPDDRAERFNDGFARMFGLPLPARGDGQAGGVRVADESVAGAPTLDEVFPVALRSRIRAELLLSGECDFPYLTGEEGQGRWLRLLARGTPSSFEASVTDITEHKNTEHRLSHAAEHDALTGALNRRGLSRRISRAVEDAGDIARLSLVYLDLDRFKLLNDLFGHQAGDAVLKEVVSRLRSALGDKVGIARLGGDEFAALLDAGSSEGHEEMAARALEAIAGTPFQVAARSFAVTASVGMFRFAGGISQEALISGADRACLDAKRKGRNQVVIQNDPSATIRRQAAERSVSADLGEADRFGEFELTIQPIVSLHESRRFGGEVLLRNRVPDEATRSPGQLVDAAEEHDGVNIDRWILRQALAWLSGRRRLHGTLEFLSLNLSAASLNDELFKTFVLATLHEHQDIAHLVVIEITETVAMQDLFLMAKFGARVRESGARLALDDFRSSSSSFASLTDVGASFLKIDSSSVTALPAQNSGNRFIRTTSLLAHELGMKCIATAVEDAGTLPLLRELGADFAQVTALWPPLPLAQFEVFCAGGALDRAANVGPPGDGQAELSAPLRPAAPAPVI